MILRIDDLVELIVAREYRTFNYVCVRMYCETEIMYLLILQELGSQPLPTIVTEDADNSGHAAQGHRPRAGELIIDNDSLQIRYDKLGTWITHALLENVLKT